MKPNQNKNANVGTTGTPSVAAVSAKTSTAIANDPRAAFTASIEALKTQRTSHLGNIAAEQGKIDEIDAFFRENGLPVEGQAQMVTVKRQGRPVGSKNVNGAGRQPNAESGPGKLLAILKRRKNGMPVAEAHALIGGNNPNSATAYLKRTNQIVQIVPEGQKRGGVFKLATPKA